MKKNQLPFLLLLLLSLSSFSLADECESDYAAITGRSPSPLLAQRARKKLIESQNPYDTGYYLTPPNARDNQALRHREIIEFQKLIDFRGTQAEHLEAANQWVKSNEHALYLYQHLEEMGPKADLLMDVLPHRNEFFGRVGFVRGPPNTLITYAFERETRDAMATLYYKDPRYTDEEWIELPENQRQEILKRLNGSDEKVFQPAGVIAPTGFKPSSLGGYSQEFSHSGVGFLMEFAHRNYEINPDVILSEMKSIATDLKSNDAFHVHLVFDLPKRYHRMPEFTDWLKQVNDSLYFSGLEEGLHPADLVQLPKLPRSAWNPLNWFHPLESLMDRSSHLPTQLSQVNHQKYKFFAAAPRAKHYGSSKDPKFQKIGIELRDISRNMGQWEQTVDRVGSGIRDRRWEVGRRKEKGFQLIPNPKEDQRRLEALGIKPVTAKLMVANEAMIGVPLVELESMKYFNYQTQSAEKPSETKAKQLKEARTAFEKELVSLAAELEGYQKRGEKFEGQDVQTVIRMSLSSWAKAAKPSSLLSNY